MDWRERFSPPVTACSACEQKGPPPLFTFLLQLRETLQHGHPLHLFTIFVATVWVLWAVKVLLSRRYRPWTAPTGRPPA